MLSHLAHVFGFQPIERRVTELWSDPSINSLTLVRMRGFEAQESEPILRTCVYSRYASLKTHAFKGFCRSQITSGLAMDCSKTIKKMVFAEGRALRQSLMRSK